MDQENWFLKVIFLDKSWMIFDRPDGWIKEWIFSLWLKEVIKAALLDYSNELNELTRTILTIVMLWTRLLLHGKSLSFTISKWSAHLCMTMSFLCVSKLTCEFFKHKRFTEEKIMKWLSSSPDQNLIKNLGSFVKIKLYEGGKQYNRNAYLQEDIKITFLEIKSIEFGKLSKLAFSCATSWVGFRNFRRRRVIYGTLEHLIVHT